MPHTVLQYLRLCFNASDCASRPHTVLQCPRLCFNASDCVSMTQSVLQCPRLCFNASDCASVPQTVLQCLKLCFHLGSQEKATKWYSDGVIDGLTTNGILIQHPEGGFSTQSKAGVWREVSVGGGIYGLRESRSTPQKSSLVGTRMSLANTPQ